jgi:hypothetical protein
MLNTYKAILKGNYLEWDEDAPAHLTPNDAVAVYVTILDEPIATSSVIEQGQRMVAALEQLAAINALSDLTDPAAWEREVRQDRPLPDRELLRVLDEAPRKMYNQ